MQVPYAYFWAFFSCTHGLIFWSRWPTRFGLAFNKERDKWSN